MWKWAGLLQRFPVPVVMLVVYMNRGNYATFHQEYRERQDDWETVVRFNTVRFWECAPQIRTGKYPDFIPLLTLCEDEPGEATVREEVALIQNAPLTEARKQELISLSLVVASRDVARSILIRIVKEVFTMNTLPPIMEDLFGDALRQRESQAEERAACRIVLHQCTKRLGVPPADVLARLEAIHNVEALYELLDRLDEQPESWEQLLPSVNADSTPPTDQR